MGNYLGTGLNSLANLSGGLDQSFDTGRGNYPVGASSRA